MATLQQSSMDSSAGSSRPVHAISDSEEDQPDVIPDTDSENEFGTSRDRATKRKLKRLSKTTLSKREQEKDLFGSDSDTDIQTKRNKSSNGNYKTQTSTKKEQEKELFGSDSDNEIGTKRSKLSNDHSISPDSSPIKFKRAGKEPLSSKLKSDESTKRSKVSTVHSISPETSPIKTKRTVYDVSTDEMSSDDESILKPTSKPMCPFGKRCYRKNQSHFAEYNHPSSSSSTTTTSNATKPNSQTPSPLGIYFTKVTGISDHFNGPATVCMRDILSPRMGNLQRSVQFNYCIDVDWVVAQYPKEFKSCPLLIVHGAKQGEKATLDLAASKYDNVRMCQARLDIPFGTHHTKMMFLLYDKGLRVVIHTANLMSMDWYQKTQAVWISPIYPAQTDTTSEGDSPTHFKRDLMEYLSSYKARQLEEWVQIIKQHDMSQTNVFLIGSIPGRHTGNAKSAFGHLKLRKVLQQHGPATNSASKEDIVVGQFSSVGSMGASKEAWLCGEWLSSLATVKGMTSVGQPKLKLIFPTRNNIRLSLEGYPAGQSVPYSASVAKKQIFLHKFFHQWQSDGLGRSRASPHIKTFLRASPDCKEVYWMLLTSCNLSKAAWGAYEKQQSQLFIRSYELGVLFLPQTFDAAKSSFSVAKNKSLKEDRSLPITVPFDLPPVPYGPTDQPWIWDIPYVKQPDSHGNMWCPR